MSDASSLPPTPEGPERRQRVRCLCTDLRAHLVPAKGSRAWAVQVRDISRGGIRLVLPHWIEVHPVVTVKLYHRGRAAWYHLEVRLKFLVEQPGGPWFLGGAFTRELGEEDLQGFL